MILSNAVLLDQMREGDQSVVMKLVFEVCGAFANPCWKMKCFLLITKSGLFHMGVCLLGDIVVLVN